MTELWVGQDVYNLTHDHEYIEEGRVEARGADWAVVRDERGRLHFFEGGDVDEQLLSHSERPKEPE